jgi:hypothetical protein
MRGYPQGTLNSAKAVPLQQFIASLDPGGVNVPVGQSKRRATEVSGYDPRAVNLLSGNSK